jgi:antitoxin component HigA of HigAB toxin-antitoxin module
LLRLAAGETAPRGPAADRAKTEAIRLMRAPEIRAEIAKTPDAVDRVRALMQTAGMAA